MQSNTGPTKLNNVAKSATAEPVAQGDGPSPFPPVALAERAKPRRGRPRKVNPFGNAVRPKDIEVPQHVADNPKLLTVFRRALADAEKEYMTPAGFDGGGTVEGAPVVTKEALQRRVARRLNVIDRYLTDDKLIELLAFSSLKDVGIYEGILLDKSLVLTGQPSVIIGNDDRARMDNVMPKILSELRRRGLITSVSERKIEFQTVGLASLEG